MAEFNFINAPHSANFLLCENPHPSLLRPFIVGGEGGRAAFLAAGENIQKERILPRAAQYAPDQHWVLQLKLPF